jgi:hypothetical protein
MQEIVRIAPVQGEPGLIAYPDASHLLGRGMLCSHLHDSIVDRIVSGPSHAVLERRTEQRGRSERSYLILRFIADSLPRLLSISY